MIFTIMTGLLTLMSMGITLALLGSHLRESNWVSGISLGNFALFFINLILTLILYVKTYQLLSPEYFRTILVKYHRRKILESVSKEFYKRLKQNLAIQFIQKLGIETSILRSENKKRISIKIQNDLSESLLVDDINLELIKLASKNAQKLKKEILKEQFVFSGLPGQNISLEYPEIASVVPELNQRKVLYPLQGAIRTKRRGLSAPKTTSDDLLINRDLISEAINAGQSENVKTSLDLYIETIDAFLASLRNFGHRFTPELAEREDGWLNRWDILEAVYSEFRSLIEEAIKSNNAEIIHEFVSFPIRVMNKALEYRDHLTFQKFVNMYPRIYILSKQFITNNQLANQIANRCGFLMAEFVNFQLEYRFKEKNLFEDDAKEFLAYAEHVLTVFSQLAKYQIDILDFTQYKLSIGAIQRMLQDFIERHNDYHMYILEVEYQNGNEIQKQEIESQIHREKALNSLIEKTQNTKKCALFGLGTWVCHLLDAEKISANDFLKLIQPLIGTFENLNQLTESYSFSLMMEERHRFNWSSWEMDEWPEDAYASGKGGAIHFSSWFSFFYTYLALMLTPENPDSIPQIKPLHHIKGTLDSTTNTIKYFSDNKKWETALEQLGNFKLRAQILVDALNAGYAQQLEINESELAQTPINNDKVKEFFEELEETWRNSGLMRDIYTVYGRYLSFEREMPPQKITPIRIYQHIPKGIFLEQSEIGYPNWGESFGRSLAQTEDRYLITFFDQLLQLSATKDTFDEIISQNISLLKSKSFIPIVLYGHELHRYFFESKNYQPRWKINKVDQQSMRKFDGLYNETVVLRAPIKPKSVVIYDPSKFGNLKQYKVDKDKPDFPLLLSVKEISAEQAQKYIKTPFTDPETGLALSEEAMSRKVQQNVELTILQLIDIGDINSNAGVVINFDKETLVSKTTRKKTSNKKTKSAS